MRTVLGLVLLFGMASPSFGGSFPPDSVAKVGNGQVETFVFTSGGSEINGKIYLPDSYALSNDHPAIFLIDFTDQHFVLITDEFETLIAEAKKIQGLDALVVTLEEQWNVDARPTHTQTYYDIFRDMALYVEANYSANTNRTFMGRGSEGGLVMASMLLEDPATSIFDNFIATDSSTEFINSLISTITTGTQPANRSEKRLHYSFTSSNNRAACLNLINALNSAQYSWLQFSSEEYPELTYPTAYPTAFAAGLNFVFSSVSTGLDSGSGVVPEDFRLDQNYPNPFNPATVITYSLQKQGYVTLKVYDSLGMEVATLVNRQQAPGSHDVKFDAISLTSGVYHYRLSTPGNSETRQMILMR